MNDGNSQGIAGPESQFQGCLALGNKRIQAKANTKAKRKQQQWVNSVP